MRKCHKTLVDCKFISVSPDKKDFDIFVDIGKIHNHMKESFERSVIDKISKRS